MTEREIEKKIMYKKVVYMGDKTVVVMLKMDNGNEFIGRSSCFDESKFDRVKGEFLAYQDALKQVRKIEAKDQSDEWNKLKDHYDNKRL